MHATTTARTSLCCAVFIAVAGLSGASGCKRGGAGKGSASGTSASSGSGVASASGSGSAAPSDVSHKLPLIDSHVHVTPVPQSINRALRIFSQVNVVKFAVKSAGRFGTPRFAATAHYANNVLGENMAFFANLDWEGIDDKDWGKREADRLEKAVAAGASGIKIFKNLGLGVRLKDKSLLKVDDHRLDPIFERAAKVGAIIAWHVADPVAFFEPISPKNERWDELKMAPEWSFHGKDYPSHKELLDARDRVLARHPKTTFLGIHLANYPENLDYVEKVLDRFPNFYVDISARVPEIGRHPVERVRKLFEKHQDRILFGTDLIVTPRGMQLGSVSPDPPTFKDAIKYYEAHRRYFETNLRQIKHPTPIQGRWRVNAIKLPPKILKKFYYDNADKLIFAPRRAWLAKQAQKKKAKAAAKTKAPKGATK